jgi:hypothetical protein
LSAAKSGRQKCLNFTLAFNAELGDGFAEIVGEQRNAEQISGGAPVVGARGFGAQFASVFDAAVAAAEPGERDQVDLLVH